MCNMERSSQGRSLGVLGAAFDRLGQAGRGQGRSDLMDRGRHARRTVFNFLFGAFDLRHHSKGRPSCQTAAGSPPKQL